MGTALEVRTLKIPEVDDEKQEIAEDIEKVASIINKSDLSDTQKIKVMEIMARKEEYSGPIPHPDHLEKYEKILSGSANRILGMAENQSTHRQNIENKLLEAEIKYKNKGQNFGFIISIICIVGGIVMLFFGKNLQGLITLIGAVSMLISAFLYGNKNKK